MKLQILTAIAAASLALSTLSTYAQQSGVQDTAEREIQRQEQLKSYAADAVNKGTQAMATQDYETAFAEFKSAVDVLPSGGPATASLRQTALDGFCDASVKLSEQRISEGRFQDASTTIQVVLDDRYNPHYGPALVLQAKLKSPNAFNKTMTPVFIANVEEVKQLLLEAQGFYDTGRYDLAFKRYEQVLNIDKYNIAARRGEEEVHVKQAQYASAAYSDARGDMIDQIDKGWELPIRKFGVSQSTIIDQPQIDTRGTSLINRKLDEITIPKVEFNDATIREALDFIKQRATALDTAEQDPSHRGINIVLDVAEDAPEANQRITLSLTDIPLRAALEYVAKAANLKLKVEPYAVTVVPLSVSTDVLITKEYKVPPSFITALPASTAAPAPGGGTPTAPGSQPSVAARSGAREFLESQGVTFPQGASANFLASSSKLIVRNTQANLDLIDTLVETSLTAPPSQVAIESKFLEVTQTNLKEMGFDWLLGQFALPFGTGVYGGGGTQGNGNTIDANSFPFQTSTAGVPVGASSTTSGPVTAGNRSGTAAISANALDALLFGTPAGPAPGILALAGIFTNPQFQVVLRALSQEKGVDLVSAPQVTTKSGQSATVEITREFRYPTEFDLPQVTQAPGSVLTPATPTTPTAFDTKPVGITLEVQPTVGPDGYTIDLVLSPRVVEFEGFINYGSPIFTTVNVAPGGLIPAGVTGTVLLTANVINQPVFSTREVTTQVTVYDGQTVVLGGLMNEDIQKTQDKVPILGDIPLAGRLFRTTADQHIKTNLIMFVTANLMDPAGQPLIKTDDENDIIPEANTKAIQAEAVPNDPSSIPTPQ